MAPRPLARLWNRVTRRDLPVWYSAAYRLPVTGLEAAVGMRPRRADEAAWWLLDSGTLSREAFRAPARAGYEDLERVHTPELLESLGRPEALGRIFALDPAEVPVDELVRTITLACGGTLEAARAALARRGPALNLQGGFHHAGPGSAGGFCAVNDVAVAVAALRAEGFGGRVAVLDLDAHPPDGLAACLRKDPRVWIGSISGSDWGKLQGVDETVLRAGSGDDAYLSALAGLLGRMPRAALTFVLAGGDVLAGDRFGLLALTLGGARRRDRAVARALQGQASVWLPAGGYTRDAWRVLAGTAMVLAGRGEAEIPADYDPLSARFAGIAASLLGSELGETEFNARDLEEALGLGAGASGHLFLKFYTATGMEHAFHRYGFFGHLRRLGYRHFRMELDRTGAGERVRLLGRIGGPAGAPPGPEHLILELVLERRRVAGVEALYIHWLSLRHPRATFSALRPRLPGQDAPGLGLAREIVEMLAQMARRLDLAAIVYRPAHYHTAYAGRHHFRFIDPARQGRFEALVRDLAALPLAEATAAVAEGRVLLDGAAYAWEADEMAVWLRPPPGPDRAHATDAERARCRFTVVPRPGAPAPPPASVPPGPGASPGADGG